MEDTQIIEQYFARSEDAIAQTANKYGGYLRMVAGSILPGREDRDECVQDTYLRTWETIPPQRPQYFRAWLGCLVRTISISRWRALHAVKRGGGYVLDPLGRYLLGRDNTAVDESGKHGDLSAAVKSGDVSRRIRFRVTELLCP